MATVECFVSIVGMDCASCSARVETYLKERAGVATFSVSLFSGNARIQYNPAAVSPEEIMAGIRQLGFDSQPLGSGSSATLHLEVSPPSALESAAEAITSTHKGVSAVRKSADTTWNGAVKNAYLEAVYDPALVGARDILSVRVSATAAPLGQGGKRKSKAGESLPLLARRGAAAATTSGNTVAASSDLIAVLRARDKLPDLEAGTVRAMWSRLIVGGVSAALATVFAYLIPQDMKGLDDEFTPLLNARVIIQWVLATITILYVGGPLFVQAYKAAVFSRVMTMDTLVSASSASAYLYSVGMLIAAGVGAPKTDVSPPIFETTTILLALVALGRTIEHAAKKQTAKALRQLASSADTDAMLVVKSAEEAAAVARLTGDTVGADFLPITTPSGSSSDSSPSSTTTTTTTVRVRPSLLHVGDSLLVSPGNVFPADAVIASGRTAVDESALTGETTPSPKGPGDAVIGGSLNCEGAVTVTVTSLPGAGALSRIVRLIEEAQGKRPQLQLAADRVASIFTPAIFTAAIAAFGLWYGLAASGKVDTRGSPPGTFALLFSLALLVVSCPCAVSLAVPVASLVATMVGTSFGALIKGGPALEAIADVTDVILDKTGTLTCGSPRVTAIKLLRPDGFVVAAAKNAGMTVEQLPQSSSTTTAAASAVVADVLGKLTSGQAAALALAADAEKGASHPLAGAVVDAASRRIRVKRRAAAPPVPVKGGCRAVAAALEDEKPSEARISVPGCGVRAVIDEEGTIVHVGRLDWLLKPEAEEGAGVDADDEEEALSAAADLESKGLSVLGVAVDGNLLALLGASDSLRPEAKAVVEFLHIRGIEVWIASGDNQGAVRAAASAVGVPMDRCSFGLTPEGKMRLVHRLQDGRVGAEERSGHPSTSAASLAAAESLLETSKAENLRSASIFSSFTSRRSVSSSSSTSSTLAPPRKRVVMMVGDGINDAVALSASDVGVAMGGSSGGGTTASNGASGASGVAMDAASVVLQRADLGTIPSLLRLAAATRTRIRWNFAWAALYNILAMPLAGGALYPLLPNLVIPPSVAGVSELFSSVPVVLGSLLLYRFDTSAKAWREELVGHREGKGKGKKLEAGVAEAAV